jgi:hypothetical protein
MTGPYGFDDVVLFESARPELLWVVGYDTKVINASNEEEQSQEWLCHANLDFEPEDYFEDFPKAPSLSGRMFTLSQGQQSIRFPPGFGMPVSSDLPIQLVTQVLNLNHQEVDKQVHHVVTIHFVRQSELREPMVPLFQAAAEGFKALDVDARHYGRPGLEEDMALLGPGCSVGQAAVAGSVDVDGLGQQFTAHWEVPSGLEINRTNVTRFLNLPYDTTAHYIAVHLHPYAESLALRDLTTDEVLFEAVVEPSVGRVGIDRVPFYISAEGLSLFATHEYELMSRYNNTSSASVDSMAVMYLYLKDQRFEIPDLDRMPRGERGVPQTPPSM